MTISPPAALLGCQNPRVLTRPPHAGEEAGQEAIDLADSVGLVLDPWQRSLVRMILAERADGRYAAPEAAFLVARQNGKGGVLEAVVLHGMFLVRDPLTLWTAHQTKTSFEAFQRVKGWIEGSSDLSRKVKGVNNAHGEEGITLHNGVRLRFLARSKSSGRGFSPQRIVFDEAQELATVALDAMLPSMGAQANWQAIYCGTVPGPETNHPEHWTRLRDRGRSGESQRLAWAEWSPEGSDDPLKAAEIDMSSRKAWAAANPALGYRKTLETMADWSEAMDPDSFAREELSIWPAHRLGDGVFGTAAWAACRVPPRPPPAEGLVLGVAVSIDLVWTSLGAAAAVDEGRVLLAAVDRRRGTSWVAAEVARIRAEWGCTVVIDGKGPGSPLVTALEDAGVEVTVVGTGEVCDASADLYDRVRHGTAAHMGHQDLEDAHAASVWRPVGERWAIGRRQSHDDVSMLEACTLAAWGVDREPVPAIF